MKHYLGICLVLVTIAGIALLALHSCTSAVDHTIAEVQKAFVDVLQVKPQITVNQRVIMTQTAPIAELAVVTKEEMITLVFDEHLEIMSIPIPVSEKHLTAGAVYRLKGGFDLREPFSVAVDPVSHELHATMPRAKILSVEQIGDLTYHGEDAWLNRVTDADRTEILGALNSAARDAAEKSSLRSDAEKQVETRLKELLEHNGKPLDIEWEDAGQPPAPSP